MFSVGFSLRNWPQLLALMTDNHYIAKMTCTVVFKFSENGVFGVS